MAREGETRVKVYGERRRDESMAAMMGGNDDESESDTDDESEGFERVREDLEMMNF